MRRAVEPQRTSTSLCRRAASVFSTELPDFHQTPFDVSSLFSLSLLPLSFSITCSPSRSFFYGRVTRNSALRCDTNLISYPLSHTLSYSLPVSFLLTFSLSLTIFQCLSLIIFQYLSPSLFEYSSLSLAHCFSILFSLALSLYLFLSYAFALSRFSGSLLYSRASVAQGLHNGVCTSLLYGKGKEIVHLGQRNKAWHLCGISFPYGG